jgi:diguanylate cyclase (GGDEF)-like protein
MQSNDIINRRFLSHILIIQELLAIAFALYVFSQGGTQLAIFFLSVAITLPIALGLLIIFQQYNLARHLLAGTLLLGLFYQLIQYSNNISLLWCLTIMPALAGTIGVRHSLLWLVTISAGSLLISATVGLHSVTPQFENISLMQFLCCFAILTTFAMAKGSLFITGLEKDPSLSSRLEELLHRDVLTQLPNRHSMEKRLQLKAHEYQLNLANFSIVLADLDNFKFLNDRYGREAGDKILTECAKLFSQQLRGADTVGRWGGNQFMLLFPTTNDQEAAQIAERLRQKFEDLDIQIEGDRLALSVSMGVASVDKCFDLDNLISCAENGIYQAKQMGRNRVVIS